MRPGKISVGARFGQLTVEADTGKRVSDSVNSTRKVWLCRCDCGASVEKDSRELTKRQANALACDGCARPKNTRHGMTNTPTHASWLHMKRRPKKGRYKLLGIKVCPRWLEEPLGFDNFVADMGICPDDQSIDRIDPLGHYEPGNCRWTTDAEQAQNRVHAEFHVARARRTRHGETGTPTHIEWLRIVSRCENPTDYNYAEYGGRGIRVCDLWLEYPAFKADMGERPEGLQIDRLDNSRGYEPGNCRWATPTQQRRNTSTCKLGDGKDQAIRDALEAGEMGKTIAARFGVSPATVSHVKTGKTWRPDD